MKVYVLAVVGCDEFLIKQILTCHDAANKIATRFNEMNTCSERYAVVEHEIDNSMPLCMNHKKNFFAFYVMSPSNFDFHVYHDFEQLSKVPLEGRFQQVLCYYKRIHDPLYAEVWADSREEAEQIAVEKLFEMIKHGTLERYNEAGEYQEND